MSSDEEDIHQCGRCKELFNCIDKYFAHKKAKACRKSSAVAESLLPNANLISDVSATGASPGRNVDAAISWLVSTSDESGVEKQSVTQQNLQETFPGYHDNLTVEAQSVTEQRSDVSRASHDNACNRSSSMIATRRRGKQRKQPATQEESTKMNANGNNKVTAAKSVKKSTLKNKESGPVARTRPSHDGCDGMSIATRVLDRRRKSGMKKVWANYYREQQKGDVRKSKLKPLNPTVTATSPEDDNNLCIEGGGEPETIEEQESENVAVSDDDSKLTVDNRTLKCPCCDYLGNQSHEFDRHLRTVHNLSNYVCHNCAVPFRDKYKLKRHLSEERCRWHKPIFQIPKFAPFTSSSRICCKKSRRKRFSPLRDEDDDQDTKTTGRLENDHSNEENSEDELKKVDESLMSLLSDASSCKFDCNECQVSVDSYDEMIEHLKQHPNILPGICRFCGKWFPSKYKLWRHLTSSLHDRIPEEEIQKCKAEIQNLKIYWVPDSKGKGPKDMKRECTKCRKVLPSRELLARHLTIVHAPVTMLERFTCESCGQGFPKRCNFLTHLKKQHGIEDIDLEVNFTCPVCNRSFKQKSHGFRHRESLHTPSQQIPTEIISPMSLEDVDELESVQSDETRQAINNSDYQNLPRATQLQDSFFPVVTSHHQIENPNVVAQKTNKDSSMAAIVTVPSVNNNDNLPSTTAKIGSLKCTGRSAKKKTSHVQLYSCFVCLQQLAGKQRYVEHLEKHRVWIPHPETGPDPSTLFQNQSPAAAGETEAMLLPSNGEDIGRSKPDELHVLPSPHPDKDVATLSSAAQTLLSTIDHSAFNSLMHDSSEMSLLREFSTDVIMGNQSSVADNQQFTVNTDVIEHDPEASSRDIVFKEPELSSTTNRNTDPHETEIIPEIDDDTHPSLTLAAANDVTATGPEKEMSRRETDLAEQSKAESEDGRLFACPYCLMLFTSLMELYDHKTSDHKLIAVFRCIEESCQQVFQHAKDYRYHSRHVHYQRAFICYICNDHYPNMNAIIIHKSAAHRNMHSLVGNRCNVCHKTFANPQALENHVQKDMHHHQCQTCGKVLKSQSELRDHEVKHIGVKSFLCEQCGTTFISKMALNRHRIVHNPVKQHTCPNCDSAFNKREHLRRHLITKHSTDKPFVCQHPGCQRAFKRKDKLQDHQKMHSTKKPYICELCGRAYRYREGLRYHVASHKRSTKYTCSVCQVSFPRPGQLHTHLSQVHNLSVKDNLLHSCEQCNANFSRPERLKRHLEKDHKIPVEWQDRCPHCHKGFAGSKSLETHIKRKHSVGVTSGNRKRKPKASNNNKPPPSEPPVSDVTVDQQITTPHQDQISTYPIIQVQRVQVPLAADQSQADPCTTPQLLIPQAQTLEQLKTETQMANVIQANTVALPEDSTVSKLSVLPTVQITQTALNQAPSEFAPTAANQDLLTQLQLIEIQGTQATPLNPLSSSLVASPIDRNTPRPVNFPNLAPQPPPSDTATFAQFQPVQLFHSPPVVSQPMSLQYTNFPSAFAYVTYDNRSLDPYAIKGTTVESQQQQQPQ